MSKREFNTHRELSIKFSQDELIKEAQSLAKDLEQKAEKLEKKTTIASTINAEIKKLDASINRAMTNLNQGFRNEPVECKVIIDYEKGIKTVTRLDTNEIIEEIELSDEDKQMHLPDESPGGQTEPEPGPEGEDPEDPEPGEETPDESGYGPDEEIEPIDPPIPVVPEEEHTEKPGKKKRGPGRPKKNS